MVKEMEYSQAAAINNYGNVAGTAYKGAETCAFHYSYKFMVDAGGFNSRGFGISSTNLVVGDAFFGPAMEPTKPRCHIQWRSREGPRGFERPGVQPSEWH